MSNNILLVGLEQSVDFESRTSICYVVLDILGHRTRAAVDPEIFHQLYEKWEDDDGTPPPLPPPSPPSGREDNETVVDWEQAPDDVLPERIKKVLRNMYVPNPCALSTVEPLIHRVELHLEELKEQTAPEEGVVPDPVPPVPAPSVPQPGAGAHLMGQMLVLSGPPPVPPPVPRRQTVPKDDMGYPIVPAPRLVPPPEDEDEGVPGL